MESLESRIRHEFRRPELLQVALTHPSVPHENRRGAPDNQRLEFLGDAILQLFFSETLYHRFPQHNEGVMTKLRARLASEQALAGMAREIDLGSHVRMGKGEEASGGRERSSTLADALEALVGAIYLDAGMDSVRGFMLPLLEHTLSEMGQKPTDLNPKGELQELLQPLAGITPTYKIIHSEGPEHRKTFRALVSYAGEPLGEGEGYSKQIAEIEAAKAALAGNKLQLLLAEAKGSGTTTAR